MEGGTVSSKDLVYTSKELRVSCRLGGWGQV